MSDYVSDSIGDTRFILFVLAAFAGASVLLAAVGLYGTLAYLTAQRTREFGIRLALGSSVRAIVAIVMRESVLLALAGAAVGLIGVAAVTRSDPGTALWSAAAGWRDVGWRGGAGGDCRVGGRRCAGVASYADRSADVVAE